MGDLDEDDPIRVAELVRRDLAAMPKSVRVAVMDDYFPDVTVWRERSTIVCEIREHLYTKC